MRTVSFRYLLCENPYTQLFISDLDSVYNNWSAHENALLAILSWCIYLEQYEKNFKNLLDMCDWLEFEPFEQSFDQLVHVHGQIVQVGVATLEFRLHIVDCTCSNLCNVMFYGWKKDNAYCVLVAL